MPQTVPNIERVKEIKKKLFLQGVSPKELSQLIHQNAIIESKANFNNLKGAEGLCSVIRYWKSKNMKEELTIKKATIENIEDITRLLIGYREFYKQKPVSIETVSKFIQERLNNNDVVILLAYIANNAVGIAQLYSGYSTLSLGKVWTLYDLYIDQNYRGKKIGQSMLERCQVFAKDSGGFRLELKTEHDNLPAKALYERFGFSKDETYVHYQVLI